MQSKFVHADRHNSKASRDFFVLIVNGLITENPKVEKTQKDTLILEYLDFLCKLTQLVTKSIFM